MRRVVREIYLLNQHDYLVYYHNKFSHAIIFQTDINSFEDRIHFFQLKSFVVVKAICFEILRLKSHNFLTKVLPRVKTELWA